MSHQPSEKSDLLTLLVLSPNSSFLSLIQTQRSSFSSLVLYSSSCSLAPWSPSLASLLSLSSGPLVMASRSLPAWLRWLAILSVRRLHPWVSHLERPSLLLYHQAPLRLYDTAQIPFPVSFCNPSCLLLFLGYADLDWDVGAESHMVGCSVQGSPVDPATMRYLPSWLMRSPEAKVLCLYHLPLALGPKIFSSIKH